MVFRSSTFTRSTEAKLWFSICALMACEARGANINGHFGSHPSLNTLVPRSAPFALSGASPSLASNFSQNCSQPDINNVTWVTRGIDSYLQNLPNGSSMSLQARQFSLYNIREAKKKKRKKKMSSPLVNIIDDN